MEEYYVIEKKFSTDPRLKLCHSAGKAIRAALAEINYFHGTIVDVNVNSHTYPHSAHTFGSVTIIYKADKTQIEEIV